jgi:hypothetical protein
MKLLKFLLCFAGFLLSLFPTTVASIYAFGGKTAFIKFADQIPAGRFWLFGIPLLLIAYAASVGLLYLSLDRGLSPEKPAKRLSIDDPDLQRKLSKLYL